MNLTLYGLAHGAQLIYGSTEESRKEVVVYGEEGGLGFCIKKISEQLDIEIVISGWNRYELLAISS